MFLLPLHIRSVLQSLLSEGRGPHTALLLLAQGQVLCQATTSDADWEPASEGEEEEEDDEEPYMATPERNRLLRGLAKSQWAEQEVEGGHGAVKVECEVSAASPSDACRTDRWGQLGKLLLSPISIPLNPVATFSSHRFPPHTHQAQTYTQASSANGDAAEEQPTEGRLLLVLNGVKSISWERMERKVSSSCDHMRMKLT